MSGDGSLASEAVTPRVWATREQLQNEVHMLVASPVRHLTTFKQWMPFVRQSANGAFVLYTAGEWCGPCTQLKPHFRSAALTLSEKHGIVTAMATCDAEANELCSRLRIDSYPHLVFFPAVDGKPVGNGVTFEGFDRSADALVTFALRGWQPSKVVTLDAHAFTTTVDPRTRAKKQAGGFPPYLLLFTAGRWCGPCMHLEPAYKDVAARFAEDAAARSTVVARIDCDRQPSACQSAQIGGYPSLVFVPAVAHPQTVWHDSSMQYPNSLPRESGAIFRWARGLFEATQAPSVHSAAELSKLRVKQLKKIVMQHGLDCRSCAEKADFIEVIKKGLGLKDEL